jgi:streptomycin 6-kinase
VSRGVGAAPRRAVRGRGGGVRRARAAARRYARGAQARLPASRVGARGGRERWALLLERCEPGTYLSQRPTGETLDVLIELLPRLWVDPTGFRPLADEAAWWEEYVEDEWNAGGRRYERRLVDAALHFLRELPPTQGEAVLLHQDLHGDNVLAARREPWLVIDPKPLAGEREFSAAPIVRSPELGHSRRDVLYRLDRLSEELSLDRERARGWTIAQSIAWSGGCDHVEPHIEVVRWLVEDAR